MKRFLPWGIGLCFMASSVCPMIGGLETKLKSLKDNLVQLKEKTDHLQGSLIKLKKKLSGDEAPSETWVMPEWKTSDELKGSLTKLHAEEEAVMSRDTMESELVRGGYPWENFKGDLANGRPASSAYTASSFTDLMNDSLNAQCDSIVYLGAGIQYLLGPQGDQARSVFDSAFPDNRVDAHFGRQEKAFQDFKKIISSCADFIAMGKVETDYKDFCKADSPVIKKFDLVLDEIKLCCQDFMRQLDERYKNKTAHFGYGQVFGYTVVPDRTYDATGPICPDDQYDPSSDAVKSYDKATQLLQDTNRLSAYIQSNKLSPIRTLADYFRNCIATEQKTSTEILSAVLSNMVWRTQGLVLAYTLLREGFSDPGFLWWATGAILFYVGQGSEDTGYRQKQGADFCCYQLLQMIKNGSGIGFEKVWDICGSYTYDFKAKLKEYCDTNQQKYSDDEKVGSDTNIKSSVNIAISGNQKKSFDVTFTGAVKSYWGGDGYSLFGLQAKADILGMLRAQELLRIVSKYQGILRQKDAEKKAKEEADNPKPTKAEKVQPVVGDYATIAAIAVDLEDKPLKKQSLDGLVPIFTKIAAISSDKNILLEATKSEVIGAAGIDLSGFFIYFIKNHKDLAAQDNYKKLLMLCDVIVRNIVQSKESVESLCLNMQNSTALQTLAVFIAFLTSLEDDSFLEVGDYKPANRLTLDSLSFVDSMIVKTQGINLFKLAILLGTGVRGNLLSSLLQELKNVTANDTGMGSKHNLIKACFESINTWASKLRYSQQDLQAIVDALRGIENAYVKDIASDVVVRAQELMKFSK